jgi:hypothetical protein
LYNETSTHGVMRGHGVVAGHERECRAAERRVVCHGNCFPSSLNSSRWLRTVRDREVTPQPSQQVRELLDRWS